MANFKMYGMTWDEIRAKGKSRYPKQLDVFKNLTIREVLNLIFDSQAGKKGAGK